jgi:hypothetical protein
VVLGDGVERDPGRSLGADPLASRTRKIHSRKARGKVREPKRPEKSSWTAQAGGLSCGVVGGVHTVHLRTHNHNKGESTPTRGGRWQRAAKPKATAFKQGSQALPCRGRKRGAFTTA